MTTDPKVKEKTVADAFSADYPELKKKYMAWVAAQKAYAEHKKDFKKPTDLAAVEAYHAAQRAWMHKGMYPDSDANAQKTAMDALAATKKTAEEALPTDPKANIKIIDADVSTELNFKNFKKTKIDTKTTLNEQCVTDTPAKCSVQNIEDITKKYLNADGEYTLAKES